MFLAQEYDATDGEPYLSAGRRRIWMPDTRARVEGYLATAPVVAPGFRTDGAWVWPESLADHVRSLGAAPQEQFYEHLRERHFLLPDEIGPERLEAAARALDGPGTPDPPPDQAWTYLGGFPDRASAPVALLRVRHREDGSMVESSYGLTGWEASFILRLQRDRPYLDRKQYVEISGREVADLMTRLANDVHADHVADSSESSGVAEFAGGTGRLRLARVFDGVSPAGTPWFSPSRLRIPEPVRRERLAAYLAGGRLVARATGEMADPLDPNGGRGVPLSYRTDGTWVWQEALAYYVLARGAAPELDFLRHIESRGYLPPADVPAEVVSLAAVLAKAGPPAPPRRPIDYYQDGCGVVARARGGNFLASETFRLDLRWGRSTDLLEQHMRGEPHGYLEISERDAVEVVDARWRTGIASPPFD
jgi:hypothetical protein